VTGSGTGIGARDGAAAASRGAIVGVNDLKGRVRRCDGGCRSRQSGGRRSPVTQDVSTRDGMRRAVLGVAEQQGCSISCQQCRWVRYQAVADIAPETVERMLNIGFKASSGEFRPRPRPWMRARRRDRQCRSVGRLDLGQEQHRL
jgi:3-oxoacyl-[acyl-carrier protein] reductase